LNSYQSRIAGSTTLPSQHEPLVAETFGLLVDKRRVADQLAPEVELASSPVIKNLDAEAVRRPSRAASCSAVRLICLMPPAN
jgi:hypothetical protein